MGHYRDKEPYRYAFIVLIYHVMAYGSIHIDAKEIAEIRLVPVAQLRPWDFAAGLGLRDWLQQRVD